MKKSVLISVLVYALSGPTLAADAISAEKIKLIDILLEKTDQTAIEMSNQFSINFVQKMSFELKQNQPDINPKAFFIIAEESQALIKQALVEHGEYNKLMYPIYSKNFTEDELQQLIDLNNTEFGKKIFKALPAISYEATWAGLQFGEDLSPQIQKRIMSRFRAEGIF